MKTHWNLRIGALALLAAWPVMAQRPVPVDQPNAAMTTAAVHVDAAAHAVFITVGPLSVQGGPYEEIEDMIMDGDQVFRAAWPANGFLHGYSYTLRDLAPGVTVRQDEFTVPVSGHPDRAKIDADVRTL